jgi:serine protease
MPWSVPRRLLRLAAPALAIAGCLGAGASAASAAAPPGVVIRFAAGTTAAQRAATTRAAGTTAPHHIVGATWLVRTRGEGARTAIARLDRRARVVSATPEYRARPAAFVPTDPGVAQAAGATGGWQAQQWNLVGPFGINVLGAWDAALQRGAPGGRGVRVAVVDTGVAYANRGNLRRSPDLSPTRILRGHDFVSDDAFPNDENGHGTFVASTIAATADNGYGMVGIAYGASIIPVRVLNASGGAGSARIAEGIRYAANRGAQVINVSIELVDPVAFPPRALSITSAPEIRAAIAYAHDHGAVVVAAAGNLGQDNVPSTRLANDVIYVGGTTEHGCLGDYSNFGPGLDLVAPGGGSDAPLTGDPSCRADLPAGRNIAEVTFRRSSPGRFVVPTDYRGTSMAAPHVSGVVALLLGAKTLGADPTPEAVEARLKATARDLGAPGPDRSYGAGLVDATAALTAPVAASTGATSSG